MVGADFGADDWKNISPAAVEHHALYEAAQTHGGILILHDSHMRTALALDDLITTFEQDGYHFVQLVPGPGAVASETPGGPILGSTASAAPRYASSPPAPRHAGLMAQVLDHLRDLAARLGVFGRWLDAEIGHLWSQGLARLRH